MPTTAGSEPIDALDVFVELLAGLDADHPESSRQFYDRTCEALCRLTSMRRAALLLHDDVRKVNVPAGSHGVDQSVLDQIYGTLDETPVTQRAIAENNVQVISGDLASELPARYAEKFAGVVTLTCTPITAGGRALGVIFADRGGGRFEVEDEELHRMLVFGKIAALAASARIATGHEERAKTLAGRIDLTREIHEQVMQRLFGVSLVIGSERDLAPGERRRCAEEIQAALGDLRTALSRPLARSPFPRPGVTLFGELERLEGHYRFPVTVAWELDVPIPDDLEPLAQSVLAEALRNADKHAEPTAVSVRVASDRDTLLLEVRNDGSAGGNGPGAGMGLRLAAFEALQRGGVLEFGPVENGEWHVRMVVPL